MQRPPQDGGGCDDTMERVKWVRHLYGHGARDQAWLHPTLCCGEAGIAFQNMLKVN